MIKATNTEILRTMKGVDGIVFFGCDEPLEEWISGVNILFTENKILIKGKFTDKNVLRFEYKKTPCLLFILTDEVKIDLARLKDWMPYMYKVVGGAWLSDFIENNLGGYDTASEKPDYVLKEDMRLADLLIAAHCELFKAGQRESACEMVERVSHASGHEDAVLIIKQYVNTVPVPKNDAKCRYVVVETNNADCGIEVSRLFSTQVEAELALRAACESREAECSKNRLMSVTRSSDKYRVTLPSGVVFYGEIKKV